MKCHDFESNLSAYLEGDLKQRLRKEFNEHKINCVECNKMLNDITELVSNMSNIEPCHTSSNFINNLNKKIVELDNVGPTVWERIFTTHFFGFKPTTLSPVQQTITRFPA